MAKIKIMNKDGTSPSFEHGETFIAFPRRQKETEPFTKVFTLPVLEKCKDEGLSAVNARVLLFCLVSTDSEGRIPYSQVEIAKLTNLSRSTVCRSLQQLLHSEIVIRCKSDINHNRLWLNPKIAWKSTPSSRVENSILKRKSHPKMGSLFE